ncbi:MAG: histidine kinase [Oscillospiraceae bacterium]|nr:histidine kinase [Oscillospiraceae bacterium]
MFKKLRFKASVVLVQTLLVLPPIILITLFIMLWARGSLMTQLDTSRRYSLQTVGNSFDQVYERTLDLLNVPFLNRTILSILTTQYSDNPKDKIQKNADQQLVNTLLSDIVLFNEPNITSLTVFSEISGSVYYNWRYPTLNINIHNSDWDNLIDSQWYKSIAHVNEPVVSHAKENDFFIGGGIIISFSQRLWRLVADQHIGAIRVDMDLTTFQNSWRHIAENPSDVFLVLDQDHQLVFSSNSDFNDTFPPLSTIDISTLHEYRVNSYVAELSGFTFVYLTYVATTQSYLRFLYAPLLAVIASWIIYTVIFIFWSSRHVSLPIQKLKTAMIQGQEKDLTARCEPLQGEMGQLSEAFNDLIVRLNDMMDDVALAEQEKAQLTYEVLLSKFSPHFLYNTLNAIRFKAELTGAQESAGALKSLASMLQFSIKYTEVTISFQNELEQLEHYVNIMRIRYGDEIDIVYDIDAECFQYICLKFLIQPAVENCFIHSFADMPNKEHKQICVRVICLSDHIRVSVEDNGKGMTQKQIDELLSENLNQNTNMRSGIGVSNVKQRLFATFGDNCKYYIESEPGLYTRVTAVIPKIKAQERNGFSDEIIDGG